MKSRIMEIEIERLNHLGTAQNLLQSEIMHFFQIAAQIKRQHKVVFQK